jgi:outer membrane immunogenic protein
MTLIRKTLTALATTCALVAATGAAQAGSYTPVPVEPPVYTPEAPARFNWTGAYAGLGLAYGRARHTLTAGGAPNAFPDGRGGMASVLLGYNWQGAGALVVGGELMLSAGRMNGSGPCPNPLSVCTSSVGNLAAARLRLGVAQDRTLVFMTAGLASASVRYTATSALISVADSARVNGWTVGLGVEHAMANGWNLRGDLEHYRFRAANYTFPGEPFTARARANVVRLSLVRRF